MSSSSSSSSSKSKAKKSDKSPKSRTSSIEATTTANNSGNNKGSASDSSHGTSSPQSRTPAHSPAQIKRSDSSASESLGGSSGATISATGGQTGNANVMMSPSSVKPSPTLWFTTEIQQMMYGFGDCRKPLAESASLIEEIVHQQMGTLLYDAEEVARMRNARFLGIEDFLFLLRKDKTKLRRLLRFVTFKDLKQQVVKPGLDEEDVIEQASTTRQPMTKRQKICFDFLSTIDQTGELTALTEDFSVDEIKQERNLRAELQTRTMDSQQYMEFCEARHISFTPNLKIQKFKDWLMAGVTLDIKPNPLAMEVLSYLAYESVAQIVDLALLVKKDQTVTAESPFSHATSMVSGQDITQLSQSAEGATPASLKSPPPNMSTKGGSPTPSPPATPTTPIAMGTSQSGTSLSSSGSKSKSKKKKRSGSSSSRDVLTSRAITPSDIREALRRYSHATGPFCDFVKSVQYNPSKQMLCC